MYNPKISSDEEIRTNCIWLETADSSFTGRKLPTEFVEETDVLGIETKPQINQSHDTESDQEQQDMQHLSERIDTLEAKLDMILRNQTRQLRAIEQLVRLTHPREGLIPRTAFSLSPVDSEDELRALDARLDSDPEYKSHVVGWLQSKIIRADVNNRLHELIDLVFTKHFFAKLNWTGISKSPGKTKIALSKFQSILQLFADVGSNNNLVVDGRYVHMFIQKKLNHAHERVGISDSKKTSCHKLRRT